MRLQILAIGREGLGGEQVPRRRGEGEAQNLDTKGTQSAQKLSPCRQGKQYMSDASL